ncbi:MAG TPA: ABC transporter permease [Streptosporangiaceae bacterium]|jgi:peptide/nickel transport system permease protein|nr:ABC transporter permease [Streptosporangiaceae bacterium]
MTDTLIAETAPPDEGWRRRRGLPAWARSRKVVAGASLLGIFVLLALIGPVIAPDNPSMSTTATLAPPSLAHLLGTTNTGQDVLSQVLAGARESMEVAVVAAIIGEGLAVVIGITAGYLDGVAGEILAMLINIFLVIPVLPLEIVLAGFLEQKGWFPIALIIAATAWPWGARILRAQTRTLRKRDYVEAARIAGDPGWRIIGFEILPNVSALIITGMLFHILVALVVQSSLAFLGIGDLTTWSWGTMLYWADDASAFLTGAWWWYVPPGICLALVGMGLALVNLGLDEVINPRLRLPKGFKLQRERRFGRRAAVAATAVAAGPADPGTATETDAGGTR